MIFVEGFHCGTGILPVRGPTEVGWVYSPTIPFTVGEYAHPTSEFADERENAESLAMGVLTGVR